MITKQKYKNVFQWCSNPNSHSISPFEFQLAQLQSETRVLINYESILHKHKQWSWFFSLIEKCSPIKVVTVP